ncbi:MAG: hypothetical protein WBN16_14625 [Lutimonas sp.]
MAFSQVFSQNLTCADFHNGTFLIPADSLISESYTVVRKENQQIEYDKQGLKSLVDIEFIDDCNYIMKANPKLEKFDAMAKYINDSGGVKVSVLEIRNDTLFYTGLLENDSIRYEQPGVMIKLK